MAMHAMTVVRCCSQEKY